MFISIQDLELRKQSFSESLQPGELDFDHDAMRQIGPLQVQGEAELVSASLGEVRVHGQLQVTMEADCDRCLTATILPVAADFDLLYRPSDKSPLVPELELDEDESETGFYEGSGIELNEVLREQVLLSLPMQVICQEACKGICPVCGQERNTQECGCEAKLVDDRWAALRNLKPGSAA